MIRLQPIRTSDVQHYQFMENLLINAFPPEEYRSLEELRNYTDHTDNFHNNLILDGNTPIGFITYWDFNNFYYVEHFAIDPNQRNGGYGKSVLEHLSGNLHRPIVLETPGIHTMGERVSTTALQTRGSVPSHVFDGQR